MKLFFLNNVPWPFPILEMYFKDETYMFIGGDHTSPNSVIVFKNAFNWCYQCGGGWNLTP